MDQIEIHDAYKKSNLFGWMGLEWEANDCVKIEDQICQFDFDDQVVKVLTDFSDEKPQIIAQIQSFARPSMKPFIGIVRGDNFRLSVKKKFAGIQLESEFGKHEIHTTRFGLKADYVISGKVDMKFSHIKELVEVKALPEFRNLGIVAGAILLKYGLYYLNTDTR